ncbi:GLPGLI family protein [Chitinophaga sp. Cy-1792]|uniref:GLPGLI family protein n=1 Tax=Chitinophaga sp. Cy-1792 TaxID=2608339 RepID=UPI001423449A|nr:GLPGLI family protein [Chitinophaga sp. Cy-1792]NIG54813.1 GLPGLI family protein [Chitinophaga sp. Cy-1792]
MIRKIAIVIISFLLVAGKLSAQADVFLHSGKIQYERKMNMHAYIDEIFKDEDDDAWKEISKKRYPLKFQSAFYDCYFTDTASLYLPEDGNKGIEQVPSSENVIYNTFADGKTIAKKSFFETNFLLQDSIRKIDWKITDETRNIAGFECRRANAVIMDSIYVVAFYTDQIIAPGGPESFAGLPGMILGVALPYDHVSWFATKVLVDNPPPAVMQPPKKGKVVNRQQMHELMTKAVGQWGTRGKRFIKSAEL